MRCGSLRATCRVRPEGLDCGPGLFHDELLTFARQPAGTSGCCRHSTAHMRGAHRVATRARQRHSCDGVTPTRWAPARGRLRGRVLVVAVPTGWTCSSSTRRSPARTARRPWREVEVHGRHDDETASTGRSAGCVDHSAVATLPSITPSSPRIRSRGLMLMKAMLNLSNAIP